MRKKLSLVSTMGLVACSATPATEPRARPRPTPSESAPTPPAAGPSASAATSPEIDLERELSIRAVTPESIPRKVLYTWTTAAQLEELEKGAPLLSREASATKGPAAFDELVSDEARRKRTIAALLFHAAFAKKRFAWPSPFATVTGEGDGSYGSVLVRIELRDDAWIVDYARSTARTIGGAELPLEEVVARPEQIAAVYFQGRGYREYVLVNEAMIARFSAGTAPDTARALSHEADFLEAAASAIEDDAARTPGLPSKTLLALGPTLAFDRKLDAEELRRRARLVDSYRQLGGAAVVREPDATFSLGASRPFFDPACKMVRKTTAIERRFVGSFAARRAEQIVVPECAPARPEVECIATTSRGGVEPSCAVVPGFGR